MRVHFHLPQKYLPDAIRQEAWVDGSIRTLEAGGKIACAQCWIYRTWLLLKRKGFPADLVHEMPSEGIVVALNGCLPGDLRPSRGLFVAGVVADYLPHPAADLQIVQNSTHARRLWDSTFMPLWPHPNILPRDLRRGDVFENVCFFGDSRNLAPEIRHETFAERLGRELGLRLKIHGAEQWHDYRESDCVIAIRTFGRAAHLHKPATKLYNAWHAGTPFIGGMDSAFSGDGTSELNYLQASSPEALMAQLRRLKDDPELRGRLVREGHLAGREFTEEAIVRRWIGLLDQDLPRLAERAQRAPPFQQKIRRVARRGLFWLDARFRR